MARDAENRMTEIMKELDEKIIGTRSMKGFIFTQIKRNEYAYIYEVRDAEFGNVWYETFERKIAEARDTVLGGVEVHFDAKVVYPNDDCFGKSAWTSTTFTYADKLFRRISDICRKRELKMFKRS